MHSISLNTAISITGLSKRTLWRRISDGQIKTREHHGRGEPTRLALDDVLPLAALPLTPEDRDWILAADGGDALAQCDLALMLLAAQRPADAVHWLTLAAKQFYPDAMCHLGRCHLSGQGVTPDEDQGLMWLNHAAAKGHPLAQALIRFIQTPEGQRLLQSRDPAALDAALDRVEGEAIARVLNEGERA